MYKKKQKPYTNNEFIVQESIGSNIIVGIVLLVISFLIFINIIDEPGSNYLLFLCFLVPGVIFFLKAFNRRALIKVNKDGFYHYEVLKTNWENFISAESTEEQRQDNLEYQFVLIIRFYQPGEGTFEMKILMRNTFNRSGEEVIEAINYFRNAPLS